jgi:hypothetical protein
MLSGVHPVQSRHTFTGLASIAASLLLASAPLSAEQAAPHDSPGHSYHRNGIGFFLGAATEEAGSRENGVALGIEYERRLSASFGIGGIAEHTYGDLDVWVYAVSFAYHTGPWRMYAAPGIEDTRHGSEKMLRLGVEYGIPVGRWEIAPQFDIDIVDREAEVLVLGLTFARGFDF